MTSNSGRSFLKGGGLAAILVVLVLLAAVGAFIWIKPGEGAAAAEDSYPYRTRIEDGLPVFDVTVFHAPSYSVWMPTLIHALGIDKKNGFKLNLTEKPGQAAYSDLASGADYACLCIAPTTFTPFVEQGADVTLLFNVYSYTNLIAVTDPRIRSARDLTGRTISANTSTGQWAVASFLLRQSGLDLGKVNIQSSAGAGAAVAELAAHRVDAILPGPVEVASLSQQTKDFRIFSIFDEQAWDRIAPGRGIPNVLLGVQTKWWKQPGNKKLASQFYQAVIDASNWAKAHPKEAAKIIGDNTDMPEAAVAYALEHFPEIIRIGPASDFKTSIAVITQKLMPEHGSLQRPLTDQEVDAYVSDFRS